jgi:hypothetical protein
MSMIAVDGVLYRGPVKRVEGDPATLKRELEAKRDGKTSLVVQTATGDKLMLEQASASSAWTTDFTWDKTFKTTSQVVVDNKPAKVLFREFEGPTKSSQFWTAAVGTGVVTATLGLLGAAALQVGIGSMLAMVIIPTAVLAPLVGRWAVKDADSYFGADRK